MNTVAGETERATLSRLRDDFEAKGYRFVLEPSSDELPNFLKAFRPDAVAFGPNNTDKVIIEVKQQGSRPKIPVHQVDRAAAAQGGWRYLLVYQGQDPSEIIELPRPTKSQIDKAIEEVRGLERSGHLRAGMLEGWSLLEALARRIYPDDIRVTLKPLSAMEIVERLAMDGQITDHKARRLRALSSVRNAIAHGDFNVSVSEDDVRFIIDIVESVNSAVIN